MDHHEFLKNLESGKIRAANLIDGEWQADIAIKQRILEIFSSSETVEMSDGFLDKEPLTPRSFTPQDNIRFVPGGSSVRSGAFIGSGVVIMPPSYVNIGAYIDEGTMIDSHVLVGSCVQVGKRVHLSAAVQIGGVLEPIGNRPVIVEDDCFIGAGVIIVEGIVVHQNAVLAPGVILSKSIPIYDIVNDTVVKGNIPPNAVVVTGTRPILNSSFATKRNLHLGCAIIVKYRDDKTDASVALETLLR